MSSAKYHKYFFHKVVVEDGEETNLVLWMYEKSVFFIWSNG